MQRKILLSVGILLAVIFGLVIYANVIILSEQKNIFSLESAPTSSLALVFGGGMHSKTEMSAMQTDRVIRGIELYKAGKVLKIMMTGDDGTVSGDNEIGSMRQYAIDNGVPADDVLVDPHGYRTYESCYRESYVYGITSTIAVSQSFHLPRIIYFCRSFGIETVGVAANRQPYGWGTVLSNVREVGARLKGWWQREVTKPPPASLDK